MAGYYGYSKSNNAVIAEENGLQTAGGIAKMIGRGATAAGVASILSPDEWHHTSKHFNRTNYYDWERACEDYEGGAESLTAAIIEASKPQQAQTHEGCKVQYLEWGGTRRRPRATECTVYGCTVDDKGGAFLFITTAEGQQFRKKKTANGLKVYNKDDYRIY